MICSQRQSVNVKPYVKAICTAIRQAALRRFITWARACEHVEDILGAKRCWLRQWRLAALHWIFSNFHLRPLAPFTSLSATSLTRVAISDRITNSLTHSPIHYLDFSWQYCKTVKFRCFWIHEQHRCGSRVIRRITSCTNCPRQSLLLSLSNWDLASDDNKRITAAVTPRRWMITGDRWESQWRCRCHRRCWRIRHWLAECMPPSVVFPPWRPSPLPFPASHLLLYYYGSLLQTTLLLALTLRKSLSPFLATHPHTPQHFSFSMTIPFLFSDQQWNEKWNSLKSTQLHTGGLCAKGALPIIQRLSFHNTINTTIIKTRHRIINWLSPYR